MSKSKIFPSLMMLAAIVLLSGCSIPAKYLDTSNNKSNNNTTKETTSTKEKVSQDIEIDFQEDGLTYDDYRIDVDEHEYVSGPIEKGAELTLHTYGVTGYEESDGLVYPFLEQKVTDSKGKVVYEESDLIPEDINGIDPDTASETYTYLDINSDYDSGAAYRWTTTYSDRHGDAVMDVVVDFWVE